MKISVKKEYIEKFQANNKTSFDAFLIKKIQTYSSSE